MLRSMVHVERVITLGIHPVLPYMHGSTGPSSSRSDVKRVVAVHCHWSTTQLHTTNRI